MKLDEIRKAAAYRCKHGHTGIEHFDGYLRDTDQYTAPRVGFLDLETSNLDATFGIILTYAIRDQATGSILCDSINKMDIGMFSPDKSDVRLVKNLVEDIQKFDRLVTYYGKRFDIPFIRTRALIDGVDFPYFGSIKHDDVYFWAKYKLKLNSNRLEVVARTLFGDTEKNHIEYKYWVGGTRGDEESLEYILDHNVRDVNELERDYNALVDFARRQYSSI